MRLRILHKLLLGSSLYLAIAVSFGVYVYVDIGQIRVKQMLVEVADDARDDVLELRRNEKNYIIRRDVEYINNIHEIASKLRDLVSNLGPDMVAAFGKEDYSALKDALHSYSSLVDRFSANYRAESELSQELRNAGRSLEDAVLGSSDPRLTRQVLEIRLLEKNYILFKDRKYMDGLRAGVKTMRGEVSSKNVRGLCDSYLAFADKLVENNDREAVLLRLVQDSAKQMQDITEKVARRERVNIDGYIASSRRSLLVSLLVLAAFGPLVIWSMARAISSPLQKLEETARRISEGEEDLRVRVKGDFETASLQKSFNVMLNKLQTSRDSLEETIRLLQEKNAQLIESEKLASIGVLASGVAHEINNPLANISLTAETLLGASKGMPVEEVDGLTRDIMEQTERAQAVVNNLLSYARAMKDSSRSEIDARDALRRSVKLLAHHMRLHDVTVSEELTDSPLRITGNSGRLEQVFVNIILNAVHAMGKGGRLALRARQDAEGRHAVLEIADSGPGIPREDLQRIFDPFFTTKSVGEGTGLGLYISYGIVKDHGGEIEVESEEGKGALFRVLLPLSETHEEDGQGG